MAKWSLSQKIVVLGASLGMGVATAALPQATQLVESMGMGFNIGNTLEVPENPTLWGNPFPTKRYVDSIHAAGFNTVRIPTAWFTHSDTLSNTIHTGWLDSVKTVVDYCIANDMYVVLNSHWDNGWLEDQVFHGTHPDRNNKETTTDSSIVRQRQYDYWKQIAEKFKDYDEHLIFAGTNEPGVNDPRAQGPEYGDNGQYTFDEARMKILQAYHQAFVNAVRETGGNNTTRTLIVQAPRTEIEKSDLLSTHLPIDPSGSGYLMAEVHFYPYQFSLMQNDESWGKVFYYWGDEEHPTETTRNANRLGPDFVDSVFHYLNQEFVNQGIPVILGELGAVKRLSTLSGESLARHLRSRAAFYGHVAATAKSKGLVPIIWDTGAENDLNMTVIRRQTKDLNQVGTIVDYEVLNAMRLAYGLTALEGNSIDALVQESLSNENRSLTVSFDYTQDTTSWWCIRLASPKKDLSAYKGMSIRAKVSGETQKVNDEFGFLSLDLAVMTGSAWDWTDVHFPSIAQDQWKDYTFTFTHEASKANKDKQVLYLTDEKSVNAFVIQAYMKNYIGTVSIDQVLLYKTDGSTDTLETFNKKVPETDGGIVNAKLIKTPTEANLSVAPPSRISQGYSLQISTHPLIVNFQTPSAGVAQVSLINTKGQVLAKKNLQTNAGSNPIWLSTTHQGLAFVVVQQGAQRMTVPITLH